MSEILGIYKEFIENINRGLGELGIERDELAMMDHVCYRVETERRYQELLAELKQTSQFLGETEVGGRMIATFELHEYLKAGGWTVPYLELPAPKDGSPYPEGLEHAELVVVGGLDRFIERHSELPFSTKGIDKLLNPEAGLKAAGISVKFHEQPLGAVVRIENRMLEAKNP